MKIDFLRKRPLFYAAILLAFFIFLNERVFSSFLSHEAFQTLPDAREVCIGGVIVSEVEEKIYYHVPNDSFVLDARRAWLDGKPILFKAKVKVYSKAPEEPLNYGDEVLIQGRLAEPDGPRNPGDLLGVRSRCPGSSDSGVQGVDPAGVQDVRSEVHPYQDPREARDRLWRARR